MTAALPWKVTDIFCSIVFIPCIPSLTILNVLSVVVYGIEKPKDSSFVITSQHVQCYFFLYSWFHIKGIWSVHSFNGDYLSIPEGTGSCGYLFQEIPGIMLYGGKGSGLGHSSLLKWMPTHYVYMEN